MAGAAQRRPTDFVTCQRPSRQLRLCALLYTDDKPGSTDANLKGMSGTPPHSSTRSNAFFRADFSPENHTFKSDDDSTVFICPHCQNQANRLCLCAEWAAPRACVYLLFYFCDLCC